MYATLNKDYYYERLLFLDYMMVHVSRVSVSSSMADHANLRASQETGDGPLNMALRSLRFF